MLNSTMTTLFALSSDVLCLIIDSSPYTVFQRLWLCGNGSLNSTLAFGVTEILLLNLGKLPISRLPRSIFALRNLRSLTIKSTTIVAGYPFEWRDIINSLPTTLERLVLSFPHSDFALFNYGSSGTRFIKYIGIPNLSEEPPTSDASDPVATHHREYDYANIQYIHTQYPLGSSCLIDIGTRFPQLHTLKLNPGPDHGQPRDSLCPADYLALPSTLTRLDITSECTSTVPFMSHLPRSLTHLGGCVSVRDVKSTDLAYDWSLAPPGLQTVSVCVRNEAATWLPVTLTTLHLETVKDKISVELVRSLPRTLANLYLSVNDNRLINNVDMAASIVEALPPTLVKLEFKRGSRTELCLSVPIIHSLPSTLVIFNAPCEVDCESLYAASLDADGNRLSNIWPPNLKHLNLSPHRAFSAPPGPDVPPQATSLNRLLNSLPQTLELLELRFGTIGIKPDTPTLTIDASLLPPHITSLILHGNNLVSSIGGEFPSSLTILNSKFESPPAISSFPGSLHTLEHNPTPLYDEIISHLSRLARLIVTKWSTAQFKFVPKTVTNLDILLLEHVANSSHGFNELPTALISLKIAQFTERMAFQNFDYSSLTNLTTLTIPILNAEKGFPTLPKGLHTLKTLLTTDACIEDAMKLPRSLRSIEGIRWSGPRLDLAQLFPPLAASYFPMRKACDVDSESSECIDILRDRIPSVV